MWLGCELVARLTGHPTIREDYADAADKFLVRAQAMLDAHNAVGRGATRGSDAAVPIMKTVVGEFISLVEQLVTIAEHNPWRLKLDIGDMLDEAKHNLQALA